MDRSNIFYHNNIYRQKFNLHIDRCWVSLRLMVEYLNILYGPFGRSRFIICFKAITYVLEVFPDVLTNGTLKNRFFLFVQ